jgi:hypothetical protein
MKPLPIVTASRDGSLASRILPQIVKTIDRPRNENSFSIFD